MSSHVLRVALKLIAQAMAGSVPALLVRITGGAPDRLADKQEVLASSCLERLP